MNYLKRIWIYLSERFPLQTHIPIIGIFTFSAICFSLSAHGETEFVGWRNYLAAFLLTFGLFFLLRVSDEYKDHEDDLKFRKYLPVPRGLVTLTELRNLGFFVFGLHLALLFSLPYFVPVYILALFYMALMFKEFFVEEWLRKRQIAYVFSHMLIIPLVDLVASAAHWGSAGIDPPSPLVWFFVVSFFNGIILEIGRKIRVPEKEESNVVSYSGLWGMRKAVLVWIAVLSVTYGFAVVAAWSIESPVWVYIVLSILWAACTMVALRFLSNATEKGTKTLELVSGLWTMGMYLNLGGLPFIIKNGL
jgi:4-hydroxybenzoate polyprenyltransferase